MAQITLYESKKDIAKKAHEIEVKHLEIQLASKEKELEKKRQEELDAALHPTDVTLTDEDVQMISNVEALENQTLSSSPTSLVAKQTQVMSGFKGNIFIFY